MSKVKDDINPETEKGRKEPKSVKKFNKLIEKEDDADEVKSHKHDIINALIDWHDKADKKDVNGNVYDFKIYTQTIQIGINTLLNRQAITEQEAKDIVAYLSDGEKEIVEFRKTLNNEYYNEGIIIIDSP